MSASNVEAMNKERAYLVFMKPIKRNGLGSEAGLLPFYTNAFNFDLANQMQEKFGNSARLTPTTSRKNYK